MLFWFDFCFVLFFHCFLFYVALVWFFCVLFCCFALRFFLCFVFMLFLAFEFGLIVGLHLHYIYAFSRHFYPKRLTVHSGYTCFISMCVPWELNPQPFALLTQCSTIEPQEHVVCVMFCILMLLIFPAHVPVHEKGTCIYFWSARMLVLNTLPSMMIKVAVTPWLGSWSSEPSNGKSFAMNKAYFLQWQVQTVSMHWWIVTVWLAHSSDRVMYLSFTGTLKCKGE